MKNAWRVAVLALAGLGASLSVASAQEFYDAKITINLIDNTGVMSVLAPADKDGARKSVDVIPDKIFAKVDMRVTLNEKTQGKILRMVDQGYTSEPSGCSLTSFGPMPMEDDLRYFVRYKGSHSGVMHRATIYPGNRSENWANNVYCEYDKSKAGISTVRFEGYFYVMHRQFEGGLDVLFNAVPVTPAMVARTK